MPPIETLVWGAVLPLVWATLAWVVWAWLTRPREGGLPAVVEGRGFNVLAAVAVTGAYALAFFASGPVAKFPPVSAVDWLFFSALAVGVIGALEAVARPTRIALKLAFWLPAAAVVVVPLSWAWRGATDFDADTGTLIPRHEPAEAWAAVGGWALAVVLVRAGAGKLGCASPRAAVWTLGLTSAVSAVVLGLSGSQFAMPFRVTAVGLALLPLLAIVLAWRRDAELPAAATTPWATLHAGTVLGSYLWYALTPYNAVLLASGPLLAAVVPTKRPWVRVVVGVLPVVVALALAAVAFVRRESLSEDAGY